MPSFDMALVLDAPVTRDTSRNTHSATLCRERNLRKLDTDKGEVEPVFQRAQSSRPDSPTASRSKKPQRAFWMARHGWGR